MAKYEVINGMFKGLKFNGSPIVINEEPRIWNDESTGQSFKAEDCQIINYDSHIDKNTLQYIAQRSTESESGSIKGVSCSDIRKLLEEREILISALREIANDWQHDTPDLPSKHTRKIARNTLINVGS